MNKPTGRQGQSNEDLANNSNAFMPPFRQAFMELKPFYIHLHSSLEEGVRLALEYFEDSRLPIDVYLLNDLIRYHTKRFLKQRHSIDLGDDYEIGDLSNNGLIGTYRGYGIRVLKSCKGDLPPANTAAKAAYFSQQLSFNFGERLSPAVRPNVVFVWDLSETHALGPLCMCCPRYAEKNRGILSVYYYETLPHPAEIADSGVSVEFEDIDIQLKESVDDDKDTDDLRGEDKAGPGTERADPN